MNIDLAGLYLFNSMLLKVVLALALVFLALLTSTSIATTTWEKGKTPIIFLLICFFLLKCNVVLMAQKVIE